MKQSSRNTRTFACIGEYMPKRQKRRDEIDSQYKWDLKTIYASDEEFYKEYKKVEIMIKDFKII